jgi:hypothetical protein
LCLSQFAAGKSSAIESEESFSFKNLDLVNVLEVCVKIKNLF